MNTGYLYEVQNKLDDALKYYKRSYNISKEGNLEQAAHSAGNISGILFKKTKYEDAIKYARKSLELSQKIPDLRLQSEMLNQLAIFYAHNKDFKNAFSYMDWSAQLKDSLNTVDGQNKILELQSRYDNEQKEKQIEFLKKEAKFRSTIQNVLVAGALLLLIIILLIAYQYRLKRKSAALMNARNNVLSQTLDELRSAQAQLIQKEKMASLGEVTAGIAHEIQNPLNFVNNFSEVSTELLAEMKQELKSLNTEEAVLIADDIEANLEKITHHGKRADAIVKGMLEHTRASVGKKELTDINAMVDEYLRLAYHGLKAKDKDFDANFTTDLDERINKIEVVQQDIGRVLLNLYNNAFYSVNEKKKQQNGSFEPTVEVVTKIQDGKVELRVNDNGNGIPEKIVDKIFQPFFTTKPTGQGTGLGLSLSYDIVKAHGGELKVETKEGEGTKFIVALPV